MSDQITVTYEGGMHAVADLKGQDTITMNAGAGCGGSGEGFSPIDTLAAAYGGCVIMSMDKQARHNGFDIAGATISVAMSVKMLDTIRVNAVDATVILPREYTDEQLAVLRQGEKFCPVHNSLHADTTTTLKFEMAQPA